VKVSTPGGSSDIPLGIVGHVANSSLDKGEHGIG